MEPDSRKRKQEEKENPPGGSPPKRPVDPVDAQRVADQLQETVRQSEELREEVEVIVREGPGNIYMNKIIQQKQDHKTHRNFAASVARVVNSLELMPVQEIYESLGLYYDEDDDA